MTETSRFATIRVDQFVAKPPATVWRFLTEPALLKLWWAEGKVAPVVGHQFTLDMPGYGKQPCTVLEVDPPHLFVYTFTAAWTLTWRLEAEGNGTRVFLEHSGFDVDDGRMAQAFERMGSGWRDVVLPRLATLVLDQAPDETCDGFRAAPHRLSPGHGYHRFSRSRHRGDARRNHGCAVRPRVVDRVVADPQEGRSARA